MHCKYIQVRLVTPEVNCELNEVARHAGTRTWWDKGAESPAPGQPAPHSQALFGKQERQKVLFLKDKENVGVTAVYV